MKGGNGMNMLEFKTLCVKEGTKWTYKGKELDSGRYTFRRQQNLDELWIGDEQRQRPKKKRRSAADGITNVGPNVYDAILDQQKDRTQAPLASNMEEETQPDHADLFQYFDRVIDEGIGYINDRFGAYEQPPLIRFKIFNKNLGQTKDHQQIMGMIHSEEF